MLRRRNLPALHLDSSLKVPSECIHWCDYIGAIRIAL